MKRFRISVRLYALVAFALLTMAAALTFGLLQAQDKLVGERKAMLSAMNENAIAVFDAYHKQEVAGTLSREDAQKRALEAIKAMRYQGSGYFWINDMHPTMIMHPIKPELDGRDLSANKDPNGKHLFVEFVEDGGKERAGLRRLLLAEAGRRRACAEVFAPRRLQALGLGGRHRRLFRRPHRHVP